MHHRMLLVNIDVAEPLEYCFSAVVMVTIQEECVHRCQITVTVTMS